MPHPPLVSRHLTPQHCSQLRHKGMYVYSEAEPADGPPDGEFEPTAFWCACTQKAFGPDGQPVGVQACTAVRQCCER